MQTREEKIKFLQGLQARRRKLEEIMPMKFVNLQLKNGIISDETGRTYTRHEAKELEKQSKTFFTLYV